MSNRIRTEILTGDSRHTLNAVIRIQVRSLIDTGDGLIQPSSVSAELTKSGAKQLIRQLQIALKLEDTLEEPDYFVQRETLTVEGTTYADFDDYLEGKPLED